MNRSWKAKFFTIAIGQMFSLVGSAAVQFALIWWIASETDSATMMGLSSLVAFLPTALLGPVAGIAADRYEIETMERALATVRDDPYYRALSGKYLDDVDDRDIAEALECDTSTVWRHRKRLVQRVAVWLYGAEALR